MAKLILLFLGAIAAILAVVWVALRAQTTRAEQTELLQEAQKVLGGRIERTGALGLETLVLDGAGGESKIVLEQSPCPHQNRFRTHIVVRAERVSAEVAYARSKGASPGRSFSRPASVGHPTTIETAGGRVELRTGRGGEPLAEGEALRALLDDLGRKVGLAKFELAVETDAVKFAIDGFLTDADALADLHRLLRRFAEGGDRTAPAGIP